MKRTMILSLCTGLAVCSITGSAYAVPGGMLHTLQQGTWTCEVPGDANVAPVARPEESFRVVPDSNYVAPDGNRGSYLLLADRLTLTSGPFMGRRFVMDGDGIMRELDDGDAESGLRCVHSGPVNIATPG